MLTNAQDRAAALLMLVDVGQRRNVIRATVTDTTRHSRGFSLFRVSVSVGQKNRWEVVRCYNDFKKLQRLLKRQRFPCPQLPSRQLFSAVRSRAVIRKRQGELDLWLKATVCIWQSMYGAVDDLDVIHPINNAIVNFLTFPNVTESNPPPASPSSLSLSGHQSSIAHPTSFSGHESGPPHASSGAHMTSPILAGLKNPIKRSISLPKLSLRKWSVGNSPKASPTTSGANFFEQQHHHSNRHTHPAGAATNAKDHLRSILELTNQFSLDNSDEDLDTAGFVLDPAPHTNPLRHSLDVPSSARQRAINAHGTSLHSKHNAIEECPEEDCQTDWELSKSIGDLNSSCDTDYFAASKCSSDQMSCSLNSTTVVSQANHHPKTASSPGAPQRAHPNPATPPTAASHLTNDPVRGGHNTGSTYLPEQEQQTHQRPVIRRHHSDGFTSQISDLSLSFTSSISDDDFPRSPGIVEHARRPKRVPSVREVDVNDLEFTFSSEDDDEVCFFDYEDAIGDDDDDYDDDDFDDDEDDEDEDLHEDLPPIAAAVEYIEYGHTASCMNLKNRVHLHQHRKQEPHLWNLFEAVVVVDEEQCSLDLSKLTASEGNTRVKSPFPDTGKPVPQPSSKLDVRDCYTPVSVPPTPGGMVVFRESWTSYTTTLLGYVAEQLQSFQNGVEPNHSPKHPSGADTLYKAFEEVSNNNDKVGSPDALRIGDTHSDADTPVRATLKPSLVSPDLKSVAQKQTATIYNTNKQTNNSTIDCSTMKFGRVTVTSDGRIAAAPISIDDDQSLPPARASDDIRSTTPVSPTASSSSCSSENPIDNGSPRPLATPTADAVDTKTLKNAEEFPQKSPHRRLLRGRARSSTLNGDRTPTTGKARNKPHIRTRSAIHFNENTPLERGPAMVRRFKNRHSNRRFSMTMPLSTDFVRFEVDAA